MKRTIQLSESDLNRIVRNSVKQILSEQNDGTMRKNPYLQLRRLQVTCEDYAKSLLVKYPTPLSANVIYNYIVAYLKSIDWYYDSPKLMNAIRDISIKYSKLSKQY